MESLSVGKLLMIYWNLWLSLLRTNSRLKLSKDVRNDEQVLTEKLKAKSFCWESFKFNLFQKTFQFPFWSQVLDCSITKSKCKLSWTIRRVLNFSSSWNQTLTRITQNYSELLWFSSSLICQVNQHENLLMFFFFDSATRSAQGKNAFPPNHKTL